MNPVISLLLSYLVPRFRMQLRGSMFLSCQKSAKLVSLWAPLHTPDGLTQPELFFAGRQSIQIQGISSMTSLDFIRLRTDSRLKHSSRIRFRFKISSLFRSAWALFFCNLRIRKALRCSFSAKRACLFSTHSHLARSAFKAKSFLDNLFSVENFWEETRRRRGRCRFLSSKAICWRSQCSKLLVVLFSRKPLGRCSFLSCLAICTRSRRSRYLLLSRKLFGRYRFRSCRAMCCLSQDCKRLQREPEAAS